MLPLRISCRDKTLYPVVESQVRPLVSHLEQIFRNIIQCKVEVKAKDNTHARNYQIAVSIHVPGRQLTVSSTAHSDLIATLRVAFLTLQRLLKHYYQQLRLHFNEQPIAPPARVSFLDIGAGFGYITTGTGRQLRFERHHVMRDGFTHLQLGLPVRFITDSSSQVSLLAPL